jgi:polysaccharide deacetylase family protein (PEP-CTERM system associated)
MTRHILTIDVEEWFHATALETVIRHKSHDMWESRVVGSTMELLDVFDDAQTKATFFVLGWIAERHPDLIREIARRGHEIASHGYGHTLLTCLTPAEFREEMVRAIHACEDLTGQKLLGYRAPSYSMTQNTRWALDVLLDLGLRYDSSLRAGPHDLCRHYWLSTPQGAQILECPLAFLRVGPYNIPIAMGGYFRLYPYQVTRFLLRYLDRQGIPANVCLHPWELDVNHPHLDGLNWLSQFRHYVNLKTVKPKLRELLHDFQFIPIRDFLEIRESTE